MITHYDEYKPTLASELALHVSQISTLSVPHQETIRARHLLDSELLVWQLVQKRDNKQNRPQPARKPGRIPAKLRKEQKDAPTNRPDNQLNLDVRT